VTETRTGPLVVAHRGASGYRPENTVAAFDLALDMGADGLELDLVLSRDGGLVVRHESDLTWTTDVLDRGLRERRAEDLTVPEIRKLRARERWPELRPESAAHDGRYPVPLLEEVLALVRRRERDLGRRIPVFLELKPSERVRATERSVEEPLLAALSAAGYRSETDPVWLLSFERPVLTRLAGRTPLRLVRLLDDLHENPREIARYAAAVGLRREHLTEEQVGAAREVGLPVFPFTYRAEARFRGAGYEDLEAEIAAALELGVDGIFTDHPDRGVKARDAWLEDRGEG
jgi:glycerophosphoryl diester phosphodiesterase